MWLFKDKNVVRHRILSILSQEYEALVTTKKRGPDKKDLFTIFSALCFAIQSAGIAIP